MRRLSRLTRDLFTEVRLRIFGAACAHSQTNEDEILRSLFARLGVTNRVCVEICAGDGIECNTARLVTHDGWRGLLVDGNERLVDRGRRFHGRMGSAATIVRAWVTRDSVNALLTTHGFTGVVDLLSLDLDGVDYWIWNAITVIEPRVVVLEYQDILGPERSWTVPYSDSFSARDYPMTNGAPNFGGASLTAFTKLARRKGYRLVAINTLGYNAFFVRNGVGDAEVPEIDVRSCFGHPHNIRGMAERFPTVAHLPWQEV
ncbi:MAG: hypothetical protein JWM95_493 [Gemmatimonadetes bacterium]|nr:hypothetical protein [Gemmatimonadota bacterium]